MKTTVRAATAEDAASLGALHVRAWQAAYRSVMPDEYLDGLRADDRTAMWSAAIGRADPAQRILVVTVDGVVVGFAAVGAARDVDGVGELHAINLDPSHWQRGLGSLLLVAATDALRDLQYADAMLWVVRENDRARRFYERHGWRLDDDERTDTVLGATVTELRYRRSL